MRCRTTTSSRPTAGSPTPGRRCSRTSPSAPVRRLAAVMRLHPMAGGWLEIVCGPMFSGKSEELMRRLRRAEIARQAVAIYKPAIDDRFDATDIVSHAGLRMRGVPVRHAGALAELAE